MKNDATNFKSRLPGQPVCLVGKPLPFPAFTAHELASLHNMPLGENCLQEVLLRLLLKARVLGEVGHQNAHCCAAIGNAGVAEQFMNFVSALASSIDAKDPYTHGHSRRVTRYSVAIARALALEDSELEDLELAGYLHDIGKIGTPQDILQKPYGLTDIEFDVVKKHPLNGVKILENLKNLGRVSSYILHHHERHDGLGYPNGLSGSEIPLGARILAIADAFDAITSDRPYRKRASVRQAMSEIQRNSGRQFDPQIVGVFVSLVQSGKLNLGDRPELPALQEIATRP